MGVCPAAYFTIFASALSAEKALCCTTTTVSLELREGAGYTLELPYLMQMNTTKTSLWDQVSQKKISSLYEKKCYSQEGEGGFHWYHLKSYLFAKTRVNVKIKIHFKAGTRQTRCVTLLHQSNYSSHMCFCYLSAHFVIWKYFTIGSKIKESIFFHGFFRKNRINHMCHFFHEHWVKITLESSKGGKAREFLLISAGALLDK